MHKSKLSKIYETLRTNLKEGILFLLLKFVRTENVETTLGLLIGETVVGALEKLENIIDDDGFEVNFLLIIQVLSLELDLNLGEKCD